MVKLQVLGNNSKTVNNIKNLTWDKNYQHNMFAVSTYHLSLIVFEMKDEKY
jgi:hypothetical protein